MVFKAKSAESEPKALAQSASLKTNQATRITQDSPSKATKHLLEVSMEDKGSNNDSDTTQTVTSDKQDSPKVSKKKTAKVLPTGQNLNVDLLQIPRKKPLSTTSKTSSSLHDNDTETESLHVPKKQKTLSSPKSSTSSKSLVDTTSPSKQKLVTTSPRTMSQQETSGEPQLKESKETAALTLNLPSTIEITTTNPSEKNENCQFQNRRKTDNNSFININIRCYRP